MNFYIFSTVLMAISANCVTVPLGNPPPGAITDHSDAALSKPLNNTSDQGGHPIASILPIDMSITNSTTSNQTSDLNGTTTQDRPAIFPMKPEGCVCATIYQPVCSSSGKTYPSECDLKCEQKNNPSLEKKSDGICSESHDHKRETDTKENPSILANSDDSDHKNSTNTTTTACACPKYYNPICGSDGVTYSNDHCFACAQKVNSGLEKKKDGSC